jgi:hypothetical protein
MKGVSKTSGKPYDLNFQTVWVHTVDRQGNQNPYPEKTELMLEKTEMGSAIFHAVGDYTLAPASIQIDRMGNLDLRPVLVPLKARATSAA